MINSKKPRYIEKMSCKMTYVIYDDKDARIVLSFQEYLKLCMKHAFGENRQNVQIKIMMFVYTQEEVIE